MVNFYLLIDTVAICIYIIINSLRPSDAYIRNLTIIGSDNGLSPWRRQAIIWTNDGILSIGPLGTNFSEILIRIQTFSFKIMEFKMSSAKWHPFCLSLNVLNKKAVLAKTHDEVMTWKHFLYYWPIVKEIHQSPMDSLYQ